MARFRFNLEAVLKHRSFQEREKQRALATIQGQIAVLKQELQALNDTVQASTEDLRKNHLVGRIDMGFIAAHRRFVIGISARAGEIMQRIARMQVQEEAARAELAEAAKQRKIIEKLRERQYERWQRETAARELAALDEVGMQLSHGREELAS
jgi:flagellar FliJ protein